MSLGSYAKGLGLGLFMTAATVFGGSRLAAQDAKVKEAYATEATLRTDTVGYGQPENYYLLVSGDVETRHMANISSTYTSALEGGAKPGNIKILSPILRDNLKIPRHMPYPVDGEASPENINSALGYMAGKLDGNDRLFIHLTDHGSVDTVLFRERDGKSQAYRKLYDEGKIREVRITDEDLGRMGIETGMAGDTAFSPYFWVMHGKDDKVDMYYAHEFREGLDKIHADKSVILNGFCYSGPFAKAVAGKGFTAVASSAEESYSKVGDSFDGFFSKCLSPRDYGKKDTDGDGAVSVAEAVDYAKKRHSWSSMDKPTIREDNPLERDIVPMRKPVIAGDGNPEDVQVYRKGGRQIRSMEERIGRSSPDGKKEIKGLIVDNYDMWPTEPNISRAYQVLLENGADPEDIYVLSNDTMDFMFPVDGKATRQNIANALRGLGQSCGSEDVLFVYLGGDEICEDNGDNADRPAPGPGSPIYQTERGYMDIQEMKRLLEGIGAGTKIAILDFKGGDGFAEELSKYISVAIATGRDGDRVDYLNPYYSFGGYVISGLGRNSASGSEEAPSLEIAVQQALSADTDAGKGWKRPVIRGNMKLSDVFLKP